MQFQSTSPYAGDDDMVVILVLVCTEFQSTSPYAGDDKALNGRNSKHYISIHVPLRGGRHIISQEM